MESEDRCLTPLHYSIKVSEMFFNEAKSIASDVDGQSPAYIKKEKESEDSKASLDDLTLTIEITEKDQLPPLTKTASGLIEQAKAHFKVPRSGSQTGDKGKPKKFTAQVNKMKKPEILNQLILMDVKSRAELTSLKKPEMIVLLANALQKKHDSEQASSSVPASNGVSFVGGGTSSSTAAASASSPLSSLAAADIIHPAPCLSLIHI